VRGLMESGRAQGPQAAPGAALSRFKTTSPSKESLSRLSFSRAPNRARVCAFQSTLVVFLVRAALGQAPPATGKATAAGTRIPTRALC